MGGKPAGAAPPKAGVGRRLGVGLAALALLAGAAVALGGLLTPEAVLPRIEAVQAAVAANPVRSALVFTLAYAALVALSTPGATLCTVLGGLLFGWWQGGLASLLGATAGAVLLFLAARTLLGGPLMRLAGDRIRPLAARMQADAVSYMLFLRLTPVFPFWLVNLAPALLGVPLRIFALTTLVGITPATFAFATAGSGLGSVVAAQQRAFQSCMEAAGRQAAGSAPCRFDVSLDAIVTPGLLIGLTALGFAALIPVALRRLGFLGGKR